VLPSETSPSELPSEPPSELPSSEPSSPSSPPADGAAGPGGPGAAWRSALASDLGQWSSSPVCASQRAAPPASASAPVTYVAITEGPWGRTEAHTLTVTSAADKSAQLDALATTSGAVVSFEVDTGVQEVAIDDPVYLGPPTSSSGPQYWVDTVRYETAWGAGLAQGSFTRIAIVDSGVQADHPDLGRTENGGAVAPGADFLNASVIGDERTDSGSHGTHVAGIAGARDNTIGGIGGAPKATIVPVRVLNGGSGSIANVANGIIWAANPSLGDADVINLSLGSSQCSETLFDALQFALSFNVTIVAAAGNCSCTTERLYPAAFSANLTGVIAVASTDVNNQHSPFSNVNDYLTISAPGSAIWSTIPATGYGLKSGTSMASPAVAAVVALLKAKCTAYTPARVRNRLTSTAQPLGSSTIFGAGLVRADLAVAPAC
jgi:subtilisin family serine protease